MDRSAATRRRRGAGLGRPTGGTRVAIVTRISTDEVNQPYSLEAEAKGLEAFVASQPGQTITTASWTRPRGPPWSVRASRPPWPGFTLRARRGWKY